MRVKQTLSSDLGEDSVSLHRYLPSVRRKNPWLPIAAMCGGLLILAASSHAASTGEHIFAPPVNGQSIVGWLRQNSASPPPSLTWMTGLLEDRMIAYDSVSPSVLAKPGNAPFRPYAEGKSDLYIISLSERHTNTWTLDPPYRLLLFDDGKAIKVICAFRVKRGKAQKIAG